MTPSDKPIIVPLHNGPLYLINNRTPVLIENLVDSTGKPLLHVKGVSLCRCGRSKNKPFCDGTHSAFHFSTDNDESVSKPANRRKNFVGKKITIHDNRAVCSHAAECVHGLGSVFRLGERPWIDADGADAEEIIKVVKKCPSGALSYSIDGVEYRDDADRSPLVTVGKNGPYYVTGGIELAGVDNWGEGASKEHYSLCRCGASANKPFCDGTHWQIKFSDEKR